MQLFVESWKPVLHHRGGLVSLGFAAYRRKGGHTVLYQAQARTLYIHYLDVDPFKASDLRPQVDPLTRKLVNGRLAPPGCEWFLAKGPTAYANIDRGGGLKKVYARLSQIERSISVPE
jgi:hypothetical protein